MAAPSPLVLLRPRYWPIHLFAIAAMAAAVGLGLWQYDAWSSKRVSEARDLTRLDPVPLAEVLGPDDPFPGSAVGRPVEVSGTWLPESTVYVEPRTNPDGEVGVWAVTPLLIDPEAIDGAESALLVVRGWAADVSDVPAPPEGEASLVGWLQPPEGTGDVDTDPTDDVLPQLRIADAIQHVDVDLFGAYAVFDPDEPATNAGDTGLVPAGLAELPDAGRFTALRNVLYALEWWVFAVFALIVWIRWMRDELAEPEAAADEVHADAGSGADTGTSVG